MATKVPKVFKTQFDEHARVNQPIGNGEKVLYSSSLLPNGEVDLVPFGKEDLYAQIQSHRDSCDIHVLIARYNNGDVEALQRVQGQYGDFTVMPKTYAELLQSIIDGKRMFDGLPVDTRARFDHSFEQFMMSMDNMPGFLEKLGIEFEQPAVASSDVSAEKSVVSDSEVKE